MKITEKQLDEIIAYVEKTEVTMDWEYGKCRELKELIKEKIMPSFYYQLKQKKDWFITNTTN
jgi:hypothetical protein